MRLNLDDWQHEAARRLDPVAWDYYRSGAHDEVTLHANAAAFARVSLHFRVLAGVGERRLATTVLGCPASFPVLVAPTAFHKLATPDGELATARAARRAGTMLCLSTLSTVPMEEVAAEAGPWLFQLYVFRDRGVTRALVERAEASGARGLVLTVDAPLLGIRERDRRNGFRLPAGMTVANLAGLGLDTLPAAHGDSGLASYVSSSIEPNLNWRDLEWLQSITRLPVVVKGVCRADDARRAAEAGVAAVWVSNHGGRQLDTAPATLEVLPRVVDAVAGRVPVWLDGGVRRGTDVVKALAMGAQAVFVGRPILWGLAVDGEEGALAVLEHLRDELDLALALCGVRTVGELSRDLVTG